MPNLCRWGKKCPFAFVHSTTTRTGKNENVLIVNCHTKRFLFDCLLKKPVCIAWVLSNKSAQFNSLHIDKYINTNSCQMQWIEHLASVVDSRIRGKSCHSADVRSEQSVFVNIGHGWNSIDKEFATYCVATLHTPFNFQGKPHLNGQFQECTTVTQKRYTKCCILILLPIAEILSDLLAVAIRYVITIEYVSSNSKTFVRPGTSLVSVIANKSRP